MPELKKAVLFCIIGGIKILIKIYEKNNKKKINNSYK